MERPERPSRHKLHLRPTYTSDSDSDINDIDVPLHITYYEAQAECPSTGGPSTSSAAQHLTQNNSDTSSNNMNDFVTTTNLITLSPMQQNAREEESRGEPQTQLEPVCRKRSAASSVTTSVLFDTNDANYNPNTTGSHSPSERPADRSHRSDYTIRPRSFCHIDNTIRPPVFKFKRVNGPIDLTPNTSNRGETSTLGPITNTIFGDRDNSSDGTKNSPSFLFKKVPSFTPTYVGPRCENASSSSSILRFFDEMSPSTSTVPRKRIKPVTSTFTMRFGRSSGSSMAEALNNSTSLNARVIDPLGRASESSIPEALNNSAALNPPRTLDDYCDLVNNFFFTGSAVDTSSQRSPERSVASEQQTSTTADIINRHISTTPDIINHEPASIVSDINSYLDPQQPMRNNMESGGEPMDSDDVIVVETLDNIPESFIVPSSRSPSPNPQPPTPSSAPASQSKPDKSQTVQTKEVPMTLQELNQSLVSLLECPVCLDHATPPIYQCCKGHILCRSCHPRLTTCPICRSRLPGDRNSVMEKVAEKLMYPCKNTVTGCSQMLKLDDKQKHEEGCGFRHYTCIITECHWKGYKPELVVHLQSNHPDKLITGAIKELHVPVPASVPDGGPMLITHHWIQSAHNEVFIVTFHIDLYKRIMKGCVIYIGSPERAEKFTYVFELKQRVSPFRKLSYSRTTHADTFKPGQPLCLSNDFSINIDIARLYHDYVSHAIPVHISIVQE